jgi:hypothetical protein
LPSWCARRNEHANVLPVPQHVRRDTQFGGGIADPSPRFSFRSDGPQCCPSSAATTSSVTAPSHWSTWRATHREVSAFSSGHVQDQCFSPVMRCGISVSSMPSGRNQPFPDCWSTSIANSAGKRCIDWSPRLTPYTLCRPTTMMPPRRFVWVHRWQSLAARQEQKRSRWDVIELGHTQTPTARWLNGSVSPRGVHAECGVGRTHKHNAALSPECDRR